MASGKHVRAIVAVGVATLLGACGDSSSTRITAPGVLQPPADQADCAPGKPAVETSGSAAESEEKTYRILPVRIGSGTTRIEVSYQWSDKVPVIGGTPVTQSVFDLGVWDNDGYRDPRGFRGWSGSRQGRIQNDQPPVFIERSTADRGYTPGEIVPGVWYVELGVAAIAPGGANWLVRVECRSPVTAGTPTYDPVDPNHVARSAAGWYFGDFHMHGYHSNPNAPDWPDFIQQARDAKLDFLMVTEYVVGRHWGELGPVQRANPDLLIWPGREIITYFGHAMSHGETPGVLEYRHGFEDVSLGNIQHDAVAAGVLFQVNHPTTFPGPLFENFCRGCEFTLGSVIDWNQVDTIEVQNGPNMVNSTDLGLPGLPAQMQNPFTLTAIIMWDDLLKQGYRITGVSGSDSKGVDDPSDRARVGYGSSATAVYARELSRSALKEAIQAGHAYVKVFGVENSPSLELTASAGSENGIFGDTLHADSANLEITVTGGMGQLLYFLVNGLPFSFVPITSDPFTTTQPIMRLPVGEGPLGTFWRVQTFDLTRQAFTTIGNPVFLKP